MKVLRSQRNGIPSFRFRRWSRKGYGVFNSLAKEVTIGRLIRSVADRVGSTPLLLPHSGAEQYLACKEEIVLSAEKAEVEAVATGVLAQSPLFINTASTRIAIPCPGIVSSRYVSFDSPWCLDTKGYFYTYTT